MLLPQCQLCVDDVSVTSIMIICPNMKKNSKEPSFRPRTRILAVGGGQPDVLRNPEVVIEQEGTSSDEEQEAKRNESDTADEEFSNSASGKTSDKVNSMKESCGEFQPAPVHAKRHADYFNELLGKQLAVPCSTWGMAEEIFRCTADEVRSRTCVGMVVKVVWGGANSLYPLYMSGLMKSIKHQLNSPYHMFSSGV